MRKLHYSSPYYIEKLCITLPLDIYIQWRIRGGRGPAPIPFSPEIYHQMSVKLMQDLIPKIHVHNSYAISRDASLPFWSPPPLSRFATVICQYSLIDIYTVVYIVHWKLIKFVLYKYTIISLLFHFVLLLFYM
jgi:hypothetical protein